MTGLQLNVGLFSGINYVELVDQLIQIDAIPMNRLAARNELLALEKAALERIMARWLTTSFMMRDLNRIQPFLRTDVTSSNPAVLTATRTGTPVPGSYTFTPLQMASAQQTVASGVISDTAALGRTGTITLGKGWDVESSIELKDLNGGEGISKGSIRLTDGNGIRATIDLRQAMTIKDVINAINDNHDVDVIAELDGDRIVLRDVSGGDPTKMTVQEVSGGNTAASLGLIANNVVNDNGVIRGNTIWRLGENMSLSLLNDGNGLVFENVLEDLWINCRDGSRVIVDFNRLTTTAEQEAGAPENIREVTVGDLIRTINNSVDGNGVAGKVTARISDDGKGLVIEDNTVGNGITSIAQGPLSNNPILRMLGLTDTNVRTTADMFSGLATNGSTAQICFEDKAGNSAVIELTELEINDIRAAGQYGGTTAGIGSALAFAAHLFNTKLAEAGVELEVRGNANGNGLYVIDNSDGTGTMRVADHGSDLASRLGLANAQETAGIALVSGATPGQIRFFDQEGKNVDIAITRQELDSIASVDDLFNLFETKLDGLDIGIEVALNAAGTGVIFTDTTNGTVSQMRILDHSGGNLATRLGLITTQNAADFADTLADLLDGAMPGEIQFTDRNGITATIEVDAADLVGITQASGLAIMFNDKLEATGVGIRASINGAGNGLIFRDNINSTAAAIEIVDVLGDIAGRLGLTHTEVNRLAGATPGQLQFSDTNGNTAVIQITQADLDAITSTDDFVDIANAKLAGTDVEIRAELDGNGGFFFNAITDGPANISVIGIDAGGLNIEARLGLLTKITSDVSSVLTGATPGDITFTDRDGNSTTITITQAELDEITAVSGLSATTRLINLFNNKLDGTGVEISVAINAEGNGLVFTDTTDGTGTMSIVAVGGTDILARLEIDPDSDTGVIETPVLQTSVIESVQGIIRYDYIGEAIVNHVAETHALEGQSLIHGEPVNVGTFQTRNLIGGLDTVLMSTLNGGFGLAQARAGGGVEVQDRSGKSAVLTFSQMELNSMQTLSDSVKLFNQKLSDAGLGITVRINDAKTGLQVVDTTGSGSHNLIFRDVVTSSTIPGTPEIPAIPAVPAVPAVDAVSADNGTGGTAVLTFEGTHWMNNFTFGFTFDSQEAGYDSDPAAQKFTFYLAPDIYDDPDFLALSSEEQDGVIQAAVNAQIASVWSSIFPPSLFGDGDPPRAVLTDGLAAQAFADAVSGGETTISSTYGTMGVTHVPEVPEVPAVPGTPDVDVPSDPRIASSFGLNINTNNSQANGSSLNRQTISHTTLLADLNGGAGVNMLGARIIITDSTETVNSQGERSGRSAILTLDSNIRTVGDFLDAINRRSDISVFARINDTGDGIVLEEFGGGPRSFSIYDADSNSQFAASLGIAGSVPASQKDADGRARIGVSETHRIEVEETDSLDDIRKKINDLDIGYSATILVDGSSTPFRLSISGKQTGAAGAFNIDLSAIGLTTETMSEAKNAKIAYGDVSQSTGLILQSANNTFRGVINGVDLTITGVSSTPVTVTSASSNMDVKVRLQQFVDNYNEFREILNEEMYFHVTSGGEVQGNILWNSAVAKSFDREITALLQQTVRGIPGITSLADLGITLRSNLNDESTNRETGKLIFDEDKFEEAWARNPEAVQQFFFDEREYPNSDGTTRKVSVGWAQKVSDLTDNLVGAMNVAGKAPTRIDTLNIQMDRNDERILFMEERLEFKRQMLLKQFYAMEQAMARMTTDMNAVGNIANSWSSNYSSGM